MSRITKPFPGAGQALLCILALWALSGIFVAVNYIPGISQGMATLLGYSGSFGVFLWMLLRLRRNFKLDWRGADVRIYFLLIPVTLAMLLINASLISLIPMPDSLVEMFEELMGSGWLSFITVAIAAPLLEELIFRGVMLDSFLKRYSPAKAIILSSIIFGIAHANPWQFIAALNIGLIAGWLYYRTRSIWPGIVLHFINNASASLAGEFWGVDQSLDQQILPGYGWLIWVIAPIMLAAGLFAIKHFLPPSSTWRLPEASATDSEAVPSSAASV